MTQPSSQQPRRPRSFIAIAVGALVALLLCVVVVSVLLPHEDVRIITPSGPVVVPGDPVEPIPTITLLPQSTGIPGSQKTK